MAHIEIENLTFSYPSAGRPSLSDVSLTIRRGEYVVLCGKSGSGKTTLLRHLKTVLAPHGKRSGDIRINGVSLKDMSQRDQAAKVGFVMQNPEPYRIYNRGSDSSRPHARQRRCLSAGKHIAQPVASYEGRYRRGIYP